MNQQELHTYCLRWIAWRESRRLYVKPVAGNVLARLQPSRMAVERDAELDGEMQFFETAVMALKSMPEHEEEMACFWLFYVERVTRIKVVASRLGIGRRTFYDRVARAARLASELSRGIAKTQLIQRAAMLAGIP
jgi:hypothetical protein